ncbi:hypothetical protein [Spirillospora sp. NPDC048819]|uniref:hypothetical protein n=1 Tax=Spirillospora sp. NPDC048819 TaxID=3155268 RepID=UPI0033D4D7E2
MSAQVEQCVLRWRTHRGGATAERFLSVLAVALEPRGWRLVRLYRAQGFPLPLLWVYAGGPYNHVGLGVVVLAVSGRAWGYHDAERGRRGYLAPCGDVKAAAEQVEDLLKHRMFPGTW